MSPMEVTGEPRPDQPRPRIAVFAGPTATVMNSAPLVTSNLARRRHGLPLLADEWGSPLRYDALRPQRLARSVTVYVEQFSAHPLERDAAHLYAPPDGYLDPDGTFHRERTSPADVAVYEIELRPDDGLVPLPYMATRVDGEAWDGDALRVGRPEDARQPFYPDGSRIFEEIDRVGVDEHGRGNQLGAQADFDFIRVIPSAGYPTGRSEAERTDLGVGDIAAERIWEDYFPYRPPHLRREPPRALLARLTNRIQAALHDRDYDGAIWLEGSPFIEETIYWLAISIDTTIPIVACPSPDLPHGVMGASGDRNLVDAVRYIRSRVWADEAGRDVVGPVLIDGELIIAAREVQKGDARPAAYVATGGHGGIVGSMGEPGPPILTYVPRRLHTSASVARTTQLPDTVPVVGGSAEHPVPGTVRVRTGDGLLDADSIPHVSIYKHARYLVEDTSAAPEAEVGLMAEIAANLSHGRLAGFVVEGGAPYGSAGPAADAALRLATYAGMPVARVGRGNAEGFVARERVKNGIAGSNLTATKARILLMACLLRFGSLPPAGDPRNPSTDEIAATEAALARYQEVFDSH